MPSSTGLSGVGEHVLPRPEVDRAGEQHRSEARTLAISSAVGRGPPRRRAASGARRRTRARPARPLRTPSSARRRRDRGRPGRRRSPPGRRARRPGEREPEARAKRRPGRLRGRIVSREAGSRASATAGRPSVSEVHGQHLDDGHRHAEAGQDRDREQHDLAEVRREQEGDELAHVVADPPALADRGDDRREVVVGEDDLGRLARRLGARSAPSRRRRRRAAGPACR